MRYPVGTIPPGTTVLIRHDGHGFVQGLKKRALVTAVDVSPADSASLSDVRYTLIVDPGSLEIRDVRPYQVEKTMPDRRPDP